MTTPAPSSHYKHHCFPAEIISHAVWLYFRFCLSFRDVEELLFERGVVVTYEAIRKWCRKFGQHYANQLRRRRPPRGRIASRDARPSTGPEKRSAQRAGQRLCGEQSPAAGGRQRGV